MSVQDFLSVPIKSVNLPVTKHHKHENNLIKLAQNGDRVAMTQIVQRYQDKVYNTAYGIIGNRETALDVTQEIFLLVWQKIGQFKFRSQFSTWLYRIAKNVSINEKKCYGRHLARHSELDETQPWMPTEKNSPDKKLLESEQRQIIQSALDQLKEAHRTILVLREMEGLSYNELAELLGCSIGRVKSRLHEARMALRKKLKRYYVY